MKCPKCGAPLRAQAKFCGNCGHRLEAVESEIRRSKNASTPSAPPRRSGNRGGKYASTQSTHKSRKKGSNSEKWAIGLLITLIIGLLCVIAFVILPLLNNIFSSGNRDITKASTVIQDKTNGATIRDTPNKEEMTIVTEPPSDDQMGAYSVSGIQNKPGFYVKYPDGTFDIYWEGIPLVWEGPDPMTYGTDYTPEHLIMRSDELTYNANKISKGRELVLVYPSDNRVRSGIVPVDYSGMTMARYNENDKMEAVFVSKVDTGVYLSSWTAGSSIKHGVLNCGTINGIPFEEYSVNFDYSGYNKYLSLPKDEVYTLGIASGSSLVETEYYVATTYFFQQNIEPYELKLNPTVDGYATIDFSDIPAGEYVLYYSYWNDNNKRSVFTTYVTVG